MGLCCSVFPKTLHEAKVDIGGCLVIMYQLDCYERWIVHVFLRLFGDSMLELFFEVVGKADVGWVDKHFGEFDEHGV